MAEELSHEERKEAMKLKVECDIQLIRASVRPVLAFMFTAGWLALVFMIYAAGGDWGDIPTPFTLMVVGYDGWYFGERTVSKVATALKSWNKE